MSFEDFTGLYERALSIATGAHRGQKDKAGEDYIEHPKAVALRCKTDEGKIAALLHDTIEDTYVTADYLRNMGFPEHIVHAVVLVTKDYDDPDYNYISYLKNIKEDPIACEVKMADFSHNMDLRRLKKITLHSIRRTLKYNLSYRYLAFNSNPAR